jgi:hypothetical protein
MIDEVIRVSECDIENDKISNDTLSHLLTELISRGKLRKTLQLYKETIQQKLKLLIKNVCRLY